MSSSNLPATDDSEVQEVQRGSEMPADTEAVSRNADTEVALTDQTNLLPFKQILVVFSGVSICALVSNLDSTIVATALPTISHAFNAGSVSSWVPSAYLVTSTAFQPLYGRFSDIFGRKATLCLAMGIFMFGSLLAGFSKSIISLIVFRGIAGAGGGGIVSVSQIIISDIITLRERGKYQGYVGVVVATGYGIGPLIGGALAQKASWRWCFWVTIPVSAVATVVVLLAVPLKPVEGDFRRKLLVIDYVGVILTLAACTLLVLPLIWGGVTFPWASAVVLAPLCSGGLLVLLFCLWEWKGARLPIIPMHIFKHITVVGVYITMFINGVIYFSCLFYLPQFFQVALGYTPIRSGVFLLPVVVTQVVASWVSGQIVSWTGRYRMVIHCGFAVWSIGCGLLSTVNVTTAKGLLVFYMLLAGIGGGQTLQTTTVAVQASVSRRDMSVVTAVRNFVRLLGGVFGLAIGSTILNNALRHSMRQLSLPTSTIDHLVGNPTLLASRFNLTSNLNSTDNPLAALGITEGEADHILAGYTNGFKTVFILNACLAAFATICSIVMIKHKNLTRGDEERLKAEAKERLAAGKEKKRNGREDIEMGDVKEAPNETVMDAE